jgi:LCP family protein required for cell wall assembly
MRTTLKRGIGRAGGPNGNGNGNGHSGLPPLLTSVNRYSQAPPPSRSRAGLILRGFGWFVLVLVVVGAGIGGGLYLYDHESLGAVKAHSASVVKSETLLAALGSPNQPAIALVAGYDHRAGTGTNAYAGSNSDTLMLLRADPTNDTLSLLSFPRDLSVPIYCKGNSPSTTDRINAAWADCGSSGGPYAAVDTMEHLTGLKINYLITLDFRAFKQIVNRLHGVYMNVDRRYYNPLHTGYSAINLHPGYQKLDGGQALSYVRFRHLDSDVYRNGRQQLFMEALKARLKNSISLSNFLQIPQIIGAVKGNLEIAKADGSAVTNGEVKSYLGLLLGLPAGHLLRNSIPNNELTQFFTAAGAAELQAPPQAIASVVHSFRYPVVPAAQKKTGGGGSKHVKKPAHKDISVLVLNGGTVAGRAANTSFLLQRQGFKTTHLPASTPANAPRATRDTFVYYNAQQNTGKKAAQELAPLFGAHTVVLAMPPSIGALARKAGSPLTVVAFGKDFSGRLTLPRTSNPTTGGSKTPPAVSNGLPVTLSAVRAENGPAHFTLMVPKKVATGSTLSTDEGARLFRPLRGKQELALTFNLNGGVEYWQIEESNWVSAPILQNPTAVIPWHHEKLSVYTSSGAIQMVAVRTPKAAYWVVNTILNDLSNSTMMAIAESLQPLR